jgi:hypothetical protein
MAGIARRADETGPTWSYLDASLNAEGSLALAGHDMGPGTAILSPDGEYEYWITVKAERFPQLLALLEASADADVLQVLAEHWTGKQSYELERLIRASGIPQEFFSYS